MSSQVPVAGLSGHVIGSKVRTTIEPEEKEKIMTIRGCPVNQRIPTKMSVDSFRSTCKIHQKNANVGGELKDRGKMSMSGFRSNNWYVCSACTIRDAINKGAEFKPPFGVTFTDLTGGELTRKLPAEARRKRKAKKERRKVTHQKITEEQLREIKLLLSGGMSVANIYLKIDKILSLKAIYNIKNGTSWSHLN